MGEVDGSDDGFGLGMVGCAGGWGWGIDVEGGTGGIVELPDVSRGVF
jgi:hypothetical protein